MVGGEAAPPCRGKYNTLHVIDVIDVFADEVINGLISLHKKISATL